MLICKYTRRGTAAFIPHLDTLRAVNMAIRRIGAEVEYSEGFNPHMKIFFGQPLPIGTESDCEYFCVYSREKANDFAAAINKSLPQGISVTAAAETDKDPNIAKIMYYADYTVAFRRKEPKLSDVKKALGGDSLVISYESKGETVSKEVKPLIHSFVTEGERMLKLRLRCGNVNLRADRLMAHFRESLNLGGYDIVKTNMYDSGCTDLDKILFGSEN